MHFEAISLLEVSFNLLGNMRQTCKSHIIVFFKKN